MKKYLTESLTDRLQKLLKALDVYTSHGEERALNKIEEDRSWILSKINKLELLGSSDDWGDVKMTLDDKDLTHANKIWEIVKVHPKFRK